MGSSLLCLIMWAATAGFQAKWEVGPSGLSGCVICNNNRKYPYTDQ